MLDKLIGIALQERSWFWRYSVAILSVAAALGLRFGLDPILGSHSPYLTFVLAVAVTVWLAGFWPAILAAAMCIPAALIFVISAHEPLQGIWVAKAIGVMLYSLGVITIAFLGGAMRQAWHRAEQAAAEAKSRQQDLQSEIDQRRKAVEEVVRAKLEWERTFDSIPDLIAILGNDHRIVRVNLAMARRLGLDPDRCVGLPCCRVVHGAESPPENCPHKLTQMDWKEHTAEIQAPRLARDGGGDFLVSTTPLFDLQGHMVGTVHVARDISESKQAHDNAARLAAIVESSDDAILSKNLDGTILTWNIAAQRILGYRADEIIGQSITRLLPPERMGEEEQIMEKLRRGERVEHFETVRLAKDGRRVDVSATVSPLKDSGGKVIGASKIIRDISKRKRAEIELRQLAEEFERSNHDLEQFAYVASHDLKEPLRMVSGHLQLLQERLKDKLDDGTRQSMFFAVDGAKRMQELIGDLLTFSRAGRKAQGFLPTQMEEVLATVRANLSVAIAEAGATLEHDPLPEVQAEPFQMMQLLQNLIGNAIKYRAKDRKPQIRIAAAREKQGWLFSVRDNGIGIDPEQSQRVFEIFQRLHTRQEYSGTGIGLAVCKRIVEYHCGRIWVESVPEGGSTFFFVIPDRPPGQQSEERFPTKAA